MSAGGCPGAGTGSRYCGAARLGNICTDAIAKMPISIHTRLIGLIAGSLLLLEFSTPILLCPPPVSIANFCHFCSQFVLDGTVNNLVSTDYPHGRHTEYLLR